MFSARRSGAARWLRICPISQKWQGMATTSPLSQPLAASARGRRSTGSDARRSGELRGWRGRTARAVAGWPTGHSWKRFFATWIPVVSRGRGLWRIRTPTNHGLWDVSFVIAPSWRARRIKAHPGHRNPRSRTSHTASECQASCSSPCIGMATMPGSRRLVAKGGSWCFHRTRSTRPQSPIAKALRTSDVSASTA